MRKQQVESASERSRKRHCLGVSTTSPESPHAAVFDDEEDIVLFNKLIVRGAIISLFDVNIVKIQSDTTADETREAVVAASTANETASETASETVSETETAVEVATIVRPDTNVHVKIQFSKTDVGANEIVVEESQQTQLDAAAAAPNMTKETASESGVMTDEHLVKICIGNKVWSRRNRGVVHKRAPHNFIFAKDAHEPDYENKKGMPVLLRIVRPALGNGFGANAEGFVATCVGQGAKTRVVPMLQHAAGQVVGRLLNNAVAENGNNVVRPQSSAVPSIWGGGGILFSGTTRGYKPYTNIGQSRVRSCSTCGGAANGQYSSCKATRLRTGRPLHGRHASVV